MRLARLGSRCAHSTRPWCARGFLRLKPLPQPRNDLYADGARWGPILHPRSASPRAALEAEYHRKPPIVHQCDQVILTCVRAIQVLVLEVNDSFASIGLRLRYDRHLPRPMRAAALRESTAPPHDPNLVDALPQKGYRGYRRHPTRPSVSSSWHARMMHTRQPCSYSTIATLREPEDGLCPSRCQVRDILAIHTRALPSLGHKLIPMLTTKEADLMRGNQDKSTWPNTSARLRSWSTVR